jgi:hypothetical protein
MYSKNFSFSPGFGMPGRVFLSKIPSWENNLSLRKPEQFARVGGAKIYGVNTSLCLPIFTPIGTMVVAMYSTQNLARDMTWEKKCMEYFWKLKPEPKWKLTIDVGLKTTTDDDARDVPPSGAPGSPPRVEPAASEGAFLIPPSPTSSKISKERPKPQPRAASTASNTPLKGNGPCASPPTAPYVWNVQSLALLLGKYMPLDRNPSSSSGGQDVASNLMSLRLLLLRHSSCLTNAESGKVERIMEKYRECIRANKQEHDLVLSVVNDWKMLSTTSSSSNIGGVRSNASAYDRGSNFGGHAFPLPSAFAPSAAGTQASECRAAISSANKFGDNFGLPLATFGNGLQNMANVAGAMSGMNGSRRQSEDLSNVPRVVSEQGPIEEAN